VNNNIHAMPPISNTLKDPIKSYDPDQDRIIRLAHVLGDGEVAIQLTKREAAKDQHAVIRLNNAGPEKHPVITRLRCDLACAALNTTKNVRAIIGLNSKPGRIEVYLFFTDVKKARPAIDRAIIAATIQTGSICAVSSCLINFARKRNCFSPERYETLCTLVEDKLGFKLPAYNYESTKDLRDHRDMLLTLFPRKVERERVERAIGRNVHKAHAIACSCLQSFSK